MGVCCCCDTDDTRPQPSLPLPPKVSRCAFSTACRHCGLTLDSALLDGHEEACRANARRHMRVKEDTSVSESPPAEVVCVVCMNLIRCYAFIPCGHIPCCGECAKQLDACPLCRQPRLGLCYVPTSTLSEYLCKHCGEFIAPTLFDGHSEVCAMLQRMKRQEADEKAAAAATSHGTPPLGEECIGTAPPAVVGPTTVRSHLTPYCVECRRNPCPNLVINLPCGHRVTCADCAQHMTVCPVCLCVIVSTVTTYE